VVGAPGRFWRMAQVPLSRPKRNIARDFSDGVLMAETVLASLYMERTEYVLSAPATTLFLLLLSWALLPSQRRQQQQQYWRTFWGEGLGFRAIP
jgi:hypothetical protein